MHEHYGYRLMHGKGRESGLVRCAEGTFFVQCRFLFPGNTYTLYRNSTKEAEKAADANGCLSFSCENDGFFFLCGEKETPILWEETENNTGAFLARQLLQKSKPLPPPEEKKAPPAPPTSPASCEAPSAAPFPIDKATEASLPPPKEHYALRTPSSAPMAAVLPTLFWPPSLQNLPAVFARSTPFMPFPLPGFRCIRLPAPAPGIPYYVIGYKTQKSRVASLLYALPGRPERPPAQLPGSRWKKGYWYTIRKVKDA